MTAPQVFSNPNRVMVNGDGRYDELIASANVPVGSLCMGDGLGGVIPHNVAGGRHEKMFALERALQGLSYPNAVGVFDDYVNTDPVRLWFPQPGGIVLARLAASQVTVGGTTQLMSNGDGSLAVGGGGPSLLYENVAASAPLGVSSTAAAIFNTNYTIPANSLQVGDIIRVRGQGIITAQNGTDQFLIELRIGGVAGTVIATISPATYDPATNDIFVFDATIVIRTIGASGTFVADGYVGAGAEGTVTMKPFKKASTAIDTTTTQQIGVVNTVNASNAGNSARIDQISIENQRTGYSVVGVALDTIASGAATYCRVRL